MEPSPSPSSPFRSKSPKTIVFLHPDLGIGGAERLILDSALALRSLGHRVTIYTSHFDPLHCFDDALPTVSPNPLDIRLRGHTIVPATLLGGRCKVLCAVLRQLHLLWLIAREVEGELKPDAFVVDQLAAGVPVLRWWYCSSKGKTRGRRRRRGVLFYCHFPDLLLVRGRGKWWRGVWRWGFDRLEGWGMRAADRVVVNSGFTRGVVERVWPALSSSSSSSSRGVGVVYPCVDTRGEKNHEREKGGSSLWKGKKIVLSINRFERKKDIGLALRAFHGLTQQERQHVRLVLAGGYDLRVDENVQYHKELVRLAEEELGLRSATTKNVVTAMDVPDDIQVLFLLSVPAQLKTMLLAAATLLVYTPANEHFGIVPLEAMLAEVPVLAADSGGPLETVREGKTGWLRSPEKVGEWTDVMRRVLQEMSDDQLCAMGRAGREWVESEFSERKLAKRLDEEIEAMLEAPRQEAFEVLDLLLPVGVLVLVAAVLGTLMYRLIS